MTVEVLSRILLACTLINYGVLVLWFALFVLARDLLRRLHGRWFRLSEPVFDAVHYGGMGIYKLLIFMFCLVPWIALQVAA